MANAIFIDTSNLNALFKVNGRFAMGVSYASCPDKLAIDAQALGTAFDVYLSMWPRQQGEGDDIINALSIGGVPFVVLREEVEQVLALMKDVPGVGTIYLCNALANFMVQSRVSNFKSVINYGDRVALVSVQNKMLEGLTVYDTPADLQEDMGEKFTCYGDLDLIDVDAIKAQYEEFTGVSKNVLVPLTHLIMSYRSAYNAEMDDVMKELGLGEYADQRREPEAPPPRVEPKPVRRIEPEPEPEDDFEEDWAPPKKKARLSIVNVLLCLIILAGCAISGIGYSFSKQSAQISGLRNEITPYQTEASKYAQLANVYMTADGFAGKVSALMSYVQTNTSGFTIVGLDVSGSSAVIRCNTTDEAAMEGFRAYLEQGGYTVGEVNSLENTQGADNVIFYNYNVVVVMPQ